MKGLFMGHRNVQEATRIRAVIGMSLFMTSALAPRKPGLVARFRTWLTARPNSHQRQTTLDLEAASDALKRDLGLEVLIHNERRW